MLEIRYKQENGQATTGLLIKESYYATLLAETIERSEDPIGKKLRDRKKAKACY